MRQELAVGVLASTCALPPDLNPTIAHISQHAPADNPADLLYSTFVAKPKPAVDPAAAGFGPIDANIFAWSDEQRAAIKQLPDD